MYSIDFTNKYLSDLKLARKRKFDETELNKIIKHLSTSSDPLPEKYRDHKLTGNYKGLRECRINPDWLLIYDKEKKIEVLTLMRTGTHADLF